jgi:hypothetical protein
MDRLLPRMAVRSTRHFDIYYELSSKADADIGEIAANREWAATRQSRPADAGRGFDDDLRQSGRPADSG